MRSDPEQRQEGGTSVTRNLAARLRIGPVLRFLLMAFAVFAVLGPAQDARATLITVTSLADFNAAIGTAPTTSDSFTGDIAAGLSITFTSGVVSSVAGGSFLSGPAPVPPNQVTTGEFVGAVAGSGNNAPLTLTWTFPFPVIGVGMDMRDLNQLDATVVGSNQVFDTSTVSTGAGFFGFVDVMTPFEQIQFSVQLPQTRRDEFFADNLIFAAAAVAVPEPGTLALFGLGLAGLLVMSGAGAGVLRRRRL